MGSIEFSPSPGNFVEVLYSDGKFGIEKHLLPETFSIELVMNYDRHRSKSWYSSFFFEFITHARGILVFFSENSDSMMKKLNDEDNFNSSFMYFHFYIQFIRNSIWWIWYFQNDETINRILNIYAVWNKNICNTTFITGTYQLTWFLIIAQLFLLAKTQSFNCSLLYTFNFSFPSNAFRILPTLLWVNSEGKNCRRGALIHDSYSTFSHRSGWYSRNRGRF